MSNPYQSPQNPPGMNQGPPGQGDVTGGIIPYKNGPALAAYYISIGSLLCCPLGIVAVVLGIMGLQKRARQPEVKGSVHAWIGIILGTLTTLGMVFILIMSLIGAAANVR